MYVNLAYLVWRLCGWAIAAGPHQTFPHSVELPGSVVIRSCLPIQAPHLKFNL